MKRFIALFLSVMMVISMLTGCSKGNFKFEEQPSKAEEKEEITRGQWIELLANNFGMTDCVDDTQIFTDVDKSNPYFNYVQACYEWEILDAESEFKPDEPATVDFAIITGVKSIGLDKIVNSVGGKELTDDKSILDYYRSKAIVGAEKLTTDVANSILNNIDEINTSLEFEQYQDIEYKPSVVHAEPYNIAFAADGVTATLKNINANVGDTIVVNPCPEAPYGYYAKITEKNGDIIKYTQPEFQDIYDHVVVKGSYEPEVLAVIPASEDITVETIDGVELKPQAFFNPSTGETQTMLSVSTLRYNNDLKKGYVNTGKIKLDDLKFKIGKEGELNQYVSVFGDVTIKDIVINTDFDIWGNFVITSADVSIDSTLEFSGGVKGEVSKTIPLTVIPLSIAGVATANFNVSVKVGAEGEVSLEFSVDTTQGVEYKAFKLPKIYKNVSNPKLELEITAKGYIRPQCVADILVGPFSVIDFKIYSGFEAKAETKIGKDTGILRCADIYAYVPLVIGIDPEKDSALGKLGASVSWSIWGSKDSPIRETWHVEKLKIVPECTFTEEEEDKPIEPEEVFDNMEDIIDTELLEYSISSGRGLNISTFSVSIDVGKNDRIGIISIPDGYTVEDIIFKSSNPECVQVDNQGNITAISQGVVTIWISTSDGEYSMACTVTSWDSLAVEFTPLSPMTEIEWEAA